MKMTDGYVEHNNETLSFIAYYDDLIVNDSFDHLFGTEDRSHAEVVPGSVIIDSLVDENDNDIQVTLDIISKIEAIINEEIR